MVWVAWVLLFEYCILVWVGCVHVVGCLLGHGRSGGAAHFGGLKLGVLAWGCSIRQGVTLAGALGSITPGFVPVVFLTDLGLSLDPRLQLFPLSTLLAVSVVMTCLVRAWIVAVVNLIVLDFCFACVH